MNNKQQANEKISYQTRTTSNLHLKNSSAQSRLFSVAIFFIFLSFSIFLSIFVGSIYQKDEEIYVQNRYIFFLTELEKYLSQSIDIAKGYEAFYLSSEYVSPNESNEFLTNLSAPYKDYIDYIVIAKEYQIDYIFSNNSDNQPFVPEHFETLINNITYVYDQSKASYMGPYQLETGATVYIASIPLTNMHTNLCFGSAHIIFNTEHLNEIITSLAEKYNLEIVVYNASDTISPIIGSNLTMSKNPYVFEGSNTFSWKIYATTTDPIRHTTLIQILVFSIGLCVSVLSAITYLVNKESKYQLTYATTHDPLTTLYNRRYLETVQQTLLQNPLKNRPSYGLLHIDIDDFKIINDTLGHQVGDQILVEVSRVLKSITRTHDLVFRIGGDEFLIVIPDITTALELVEMRKRLEHDFEENFQYQQFPSFSGLSMGIALYTKDSKDFDSVMRMADADMYNVKRIRKALRSHNMTPSTKK